MQPLMHPWHRALHRQQSEPDTRFLRSAAHHEPPAASLVVKPAAGQAELVVIERFKVLGLDQATGKTLWSYEKPSDFRNSIRPTKKRFSM